MYPDRDIDLEAPPPWQADALTRDLDLGTLFGAMAGGDAYLHEMAQRAVLSTVDDPAIIAYRQRVLADCLANPEPVRRLYATAVDAITGEKHIFGGLFRSPDGILYRSSQVLQMLVGMLRRLRSIADQHGEAFTSDGFARFFQMIAKELGDDYLHTVEEHLRQLQFRNGVLVSARLGRGLKGRDHVLRRPNRQPGWWQRISGTNPNGYTYRVPERDENGLRALGELRGRGINLAANALAQSADHILAFFAMLRAELAFYVGCLNLHETLTGKGEPTCLPDPLPAGPPALGFQGLYDVSLSVNLGERRAVGNDLDADGATLVVVTGANQGGKSTFLRSLGLAQVMTQCGMFVAAQSFHANVCTGIFTHFKREEDATMRSGKFDEELARMSGLADHLRPGGMVLFNESFAATNEREGSQIGREIVRALRESGVKVLLVTHMYDLAESLYREDADAAVFLRPQRYEDGRRTFRIEAGRPLPTSYGVDLYRRVFDQDTPS